MARKQEIPKVEESNNKPSGSRQGKLRLIKKSRENSSESEALPSGRTNTHANTNIPSEQKPSLSPEDLQSRIAIQAHELYLRRGGHHGHDREDWFEAKRQVTSGEQ
ncbi:MAG: hypothetical protein NPIRA04_27550 [Nitrospirales bacterium]|nr:MAG: hypothetical protein NPIRA04_27550 [Nitrospirales bacterium]